MARNVVAESPPSKETSVHYSTLSNESGGGIPGLESLAQQSISTIAEAGSGSPGSGESQRSPCTSINIQQVVVYNFAPSGSQSNDASQATRKWSNRGKLSNRISSSSGPFCRICHEGDGQEELVSPCNCTGTLGLVHITCMEHWLSASNTDGCEICKCKFILKRSPRPFREWIRSNSAEGIQRNIIGDVVCFLLLTPLASMSSLMCINGAMQQAVWKNIWEAASLIALAAFLITIYIGWCVLTIRYHCKRWRTWRKRNQQVRVLSVMRRRPSMRRANAGAGGNGVIIEEPNVPPEEGSPRSPSADSNVFIDNLENDNSPLNPVISELERHLQRGVVNPLFHIHDLPNGASRSDGPSQVEDTRV